MKVYRKNEIWIGFILDSLEAIREFISLITGFAGVEILQFTRLHWVVIVRPGGALHLGADA